MNVITDYTKIIVILRKLQRCKCYSDFDYYIRCIGLHVLCLTPIISDNYRCIVK